MQTTLYRYIKISLWLTIFILPAATHSQTIPYGNNMSSVPLNVSIIWDPEDFPQWNSIQYTKELISRFGNLSAGLSNLISVNIYYAVDNEETQRQLLMLQKGQSILFSYTQGRILIPSLTWKDSAIFAGVSPEQINSEIKDDRGKTLFKNQKTPKMLSESYSKNKYATLMVSENIYPGAPNLMGWAYFINGLLPNNQKILSFSQNETSGTIKKDNIDLFVIEDTKTICGIMNELVGPMLKDYGIEPKIRKMNAEDVDGKNYIKKLKAERIPLYFFNKAIEKSKSFEKLVKSEIIYKQDNPADKQDIPQQVEESNWKPELVRDIEIPILRDNYYILDVKGTSVLLLKNKRIPKNLKIFVMAQCPSGITTENAIFDSIEKGDIPKDISVEIHYIVHATTIPSTPFISLHGTAEWEEEVRQKIIQEYFTDRFSKYLLLRNKTPDSSLWDMAAIEAGIDPEFIKEKFEEGKKYLAADSALVDELGINVSPTFLWENQELLVGIGSLKRTKGFENINIVEESPCSEPR